jgi:hypothetical protein
VSNETLDRTNAKVAERGLASKSGSDCHQTANLGGPRPGQMHKILAGMCVTLQI